MSVGRVLAEGAASIAALLCGIRAIDRASQRATAALEEAQQRRREYARSVQRHFATCFAKGESVLASSGLCDITEHIHAHLPILSPDEVCLSPFPIFLHLCSFFHFNHFSHLHFPPFPTSFGAG